MLKKLITLLIITIILSGSEIVAKGKGRSSKSSGISKSKSSNNFTTNRNRHHEDTEHAKQIKNKETAIISTKFGDIELEFFDEIAPKHVESFKLHAKSGYYNGTTFHRVIPGFMIQGGDPLTRFEDKSRHGTGGNAAKFFGIGIESDKSTWDLPAEFNSTPHVRGILSMARSQNPDSGGSQFFICVADAPFLNNQYTVFGKVISGLSVVDQIVNVPRDSRDNPNDRVEMEVRINEITKIIPPGQNITSSDQKGLGIFSTILFAWFIAVIASYWIIFTKAGESGWKIFIPIYNIIVTLKISKKPIWWIFLLLVPLVNFVVVILINIALSKSFGKSKGFGVGLTFLPFIFAPLLAFKKETTYCH